MHSEPQDGVAGRSRRSMLVALTLVAGSLVAGHAWADIQVHVMNCTSDDLEIQAFDSKDSVKAVAASTKKLNGQSGESTSLHCAGEGRGYCQMIIAVTDKPIACAKADSSSGISGSVQFHLDSDKWAVVTGFQVENDSCKPIYQVNLDSASCN